MRRSLLPLALATALAVTGCVEPAKTGTQVTNTALGLGQLQPGQALSGLVKAPAGVVSSGSANVVSSGSANVVSSGSANVVSSGSMNYATLAVTESGLAGTYVALTDAAGQPIPGVAPVKTDAQGRYRFEGVPTGQVVAVQVHVQAKSGKAARLRTLVRLTDRPGTADVSAASTMVASALLNQGGMVLSRFQASPFDKAVATCARLLDEARLPDWADEAAVTAYWKDMAASSPELASDWVTLAAGQVRTVAGGAEAGSADGRAGARFAGCRGVAFDARGFAYVADQDNHRIRRVSPDGEVTTIAGATKGWKNAKGLDAQFNTPTDVVVDAAGNVYVADYGNHAVRKITPDGMVTTLAGTGESGYREDSDTVKGQFNHPIGLAIDGNGTLYVADQDNHAVRLVTAGGQVRNFAGTGQAGTGGAFNRPSDVALAADGTVYVADSGNHVVRKIAPNGELSTFAGTSEGYQNGAAGEAKFSLPRGLAVDAIGNVYVADAGNHLVRMIGTDGKVYTLAGEHVVNAASRQPEGGFADGEPAKARFHTPSAVSVTADGWLLVADSGNHRLRRLF